MKILGFSGVLLAALAMACSSSDGGGSGGSSGNFSGGGNNGSTVSTASYCGAVCSKNQQCDQTFDVQTCTAECSNDLAASLPKMRADFVTKIQSCYQAKDCASVFNGDAVEACADEASAMLAPSQAGVTLCNELETALGKCGGELDQAVCLQFAKQYNDATLNAARGCTSKACSDIVSCVDAQFGIESSSGGSNTCEWAFDGVCDEPEYCAPGTDSYDCG